MGKLIPFGKKPASGNGNGNGGGSKCPPHDYKFHSRDENINPDTGMANPRIFKVCAKCGDVKQQGV